MIQVIHEYSNFTERWWYKVLKNGVYVKNFYWKWCAIRFAKNLHKSMNKKSVVVFEIPD